MTQPAWTANDIPPQRERVAIVTGATSGIGKETARVLAAKGAKVVLAVRDVEKGRSAAAEMRANLPDAEFSVRRLDLASLASVRKFSEEFLHYETRLDILVNNAGVMFPPYSKTEDGFELQMGTNHFGHFALTGRLMPLLRATPGARVAVVSSLAHTRGALDFSDLDWEKRRFVTAQAYCDSKIANIYFMLELARRIAQREDRIVVAAAHPGWTRTDLQRHSNLLLLLNHVLSQGPDMGALPTLRAACGVGVAAGDYYGPSKHFEMHGPPVKVKAVPRALDPAIAAQLWAVSEQRTGVVF